MKISYIPIIQTRDAELRALENLGEDIKGKIIPLFELTRSRRTKHLPGGDIFRRLKQICEEFAEYPFILDLSGTYTNEQIDQLQKSDNGYQNWVEFLLKSKKDCPYLIPTVQISDTGITSEDDYKERLRKQINALDKNFEHIVYRFPVSYDDYEYDLAIICSALKHNKLICIVDSGFVLQGKAGSYAQKIQEILERLSRFKQILEFVSTATSFPKNPTDFGQQEAGDLNLEEISLYNELKRVRKDLVYGDYATINPELSDQAGGNGWVPRIDMPTKESLFYHRCRRGKKEDSYDAAYVRVARLMQADTRYQIVRRRLSRCWGIEQIEEAAEGDPQGLSPSFWISVRMNIHLRLRTMLLNV